MSRDLGARMKRHSVGEVRNGPPRIDQSPTELDLLMAVPELTEVPARIVIRLHANRVRRADEERCRSSPIRSVAPDAGNVPPARVAVFVVQAQRDRAELWIGVECSQDLVRDICIELGVVVEQADDVGPRGLDPDVTPGRNTDVLRQVDHVDARPTLDDVGNVGTVRHDHGATFALAEFLVSNRIERPFELRRTSGHRQHDPVDRRRPDGDRRAPSILGLTHARQDRCELTQRRRAVAVPTTPRCRPRSLASPLMSASPATEADLELRDAHESARLGPYLRDLWSRRSYIWYVSTNELRSRQVTNVLGNLWHLLNPALSIGVYFVIFGLLLDVGDRSSNNFFLFLTVGLFVFQFTQKATTDGAKSIINNLGLLKAIKFPRAMLPITSTVTETIAFWPSFLVIYFIAGVSVGVRWEWLLLPAVIAVQAVFNTGSAMIAARLTTHFRDTTQILPFFFRLLLYGSGVIFNVDSYAEGNKTVELLFTLNPMYCFITVARWTVMGTPLKAAYIISMLVWTVAIAVIGFLWFKAAEERYARE
jgi:teichoic acid transport system permease protein